MRFGLYNTGYFGQAAPDVVTQYHTEFWQGLQARIQPMPYPVGSQSTVVASPFLPPPRGAKLAQHIESAEGSCALAGCSVYRLANVALRGLAEHHILYQRGGGVLQTDTSKLFEPAAKPSSKPLLWGRVADPKEIERVAGELSRRVGEGPNNLTELTYWTSNKMISFLNYPELHGAHRIEANGICFSGILASGACVMRVTNWAHFISTMMHCFGERALKICITAGIVDPKDKIKMILNGYFPVMHSLDEVNIHGQRTDPFEALLHDLLHYLEQLHLLPWQRKSILFLCLELMGFKDRIRSLRFQRDLRERESSPSFPIADRHEACVEDLLDLDFANEGVGLTKIFHKLFWPGDRFFWNSYFREPLSDVITERRKVVLELLSAFVATLQSNQGLILEGSSDVDVAEKEFTAFVATVEKFSEYMRGWNGQDIRESLWDELKAA